MGKRVPSHYVQINKPVQSRLSPEGLIRKILEEDRREAKAERERKKRFEQWWARRVETANRANHARRLTKQGTIASHGTGVCTLTLAEWQEIQKRYQYRCAYCQLRRPLTKDHIVPVSKGGFHTRLNVIPACRSCNSSKGNRPAHLYNPTLIPF